MDTCQNCRGIGEVQCGEVRQHGRWAMQWTVCRECNGTGKVPRPANIVQFPARPTAKIVQLPLPAS
jgi:DnaJ-class molecular chaperone